MEHESVSAHAVPEPSGRISSWRDFEDRFGAAMAMAATQARELTLVDSDFVHWPIGRRSVMEAFHQWGLASRMTRCRLLAATYDAFPRQHPLWVAWRGHWAHRVQCHEAPADLASALQPMVIVHGCLGLRLIDPLHGTGVWTRDEGSLAVWLTEVDVILQRSHEAMPPTTLGL